MTAFRFSAVRRRRVAGRRAGTTLTEVLMSLLVMGIGLTSVIYLFPLSLQRSIQATKLTNATLLRQNAEQLIKAIQSSDAAGNVIQRAIIEDPDNDGNPRNNDGNFIFDPLGAVIAASDGTAPAIGADPMNSLTYNATTFGDFNGDGVSDPIVAGSPFIKRYTFGLDKVDPLDPLGPAEDFVTLPDSFIQLADVLAGLVSVSGTTVTLHPKVRLDEYVGQTVRVTVLHATQRASFVSNATIDSGTQLTLARALPASYTSPANNVGRVLIDLPERRYTWIATVKRLTYRSDPNVTVVVFFRRSFSPQDERVYLCGEPAGSYNEFTYNPGDNSGTAKPPGLVAGGWMFDLYTFRWWKITGVQTDKTTGLTRYTVNPEEVDPSAAPRGPGTLNGPVYAVFPTNVVEAYTLK